MDWKKKLLEEGFLELGPFRVELSLDNTFLDLDYIPRVIVYDEVSGSWYVMRNPIPRGETLSEGWKNAVDVLERACRLEEVDLGDREVSRRFIEVFRKFCREF